MEEATREKKLPDEYIRTGAGRLLGIIKLLEAIAGCGAFLYLLAKPNVVLLAVRQMAEGLAGAQSTYLTGFDLYFQALTPVILVDLVLIILESFAGFFTQVARKGAGIVKFCHLFRFWGCVLGDIAILIGVVRYLRAAARIASQAAKVSYGSVFGLLGSTGMLVGFAVLLGGGSILAYYHLCVGRVMRQVALEIREGSMQPFQRKNQLGREAGWLGGLLIFSAVLSVIELTGNRLVSGLAWLINPLDLSWGGGGWPGIAIALVLALKFFLVRRCSGDFDRAHR